MTVVGLSASAVKRRVDRMRASGTIMGYTAVFDPGALGWNTEAYVEIFCGATSRHTAEGPAAVSFKRRRRAFDLSRVRRQNLP